MVAAQLLKAQIITQAAARELVVGLASTHFFGGNYARDVPGCTWRGVDIACRFAETWAGKGTEASEGELGTPSSACARQCRHFGRPVFLEHQPHQQMILQYANSETRRLAKASGCRIVHMLFCGNKRQETVHI